MLLHELGQLLGTEHLARWILRIGQSIAEEDDGVAGSGREGELLVGHIGKESKREALGVDGLDLAVAADERLHRTRV